MRNIVIGLTIILAVAVGSWFFVKQRQITVPVATLEKAVPIQVFGLGTVEARIVARIGFEVGAALVKLEVDHGDLVTNGSILARLHSGEQVAKVEKANAGILSAEAGLKQAAATVRKARAVLAQIQAANKRKQKLVKSGNVSIEVADEAQRDEDVGNAELAIALSNVELSKARLADANAQYDFEKTLLDHHTLAAPFNGMVVKRHRELGDVVKAGDAIFTLTDPATVWVLAYVDESRAGHIRLEQTAEIRFRSLPQQKFRGNVARIGIESDRVSEERRVYVKCVDCPATFHLGEQAEVIITTTILDRALLVPEAAVLNFDGATATVWTFEEGTIRQRKIVVGHRTADARLEIASGLPVGAKVIVKHTRALRVGRSGRAIEADGK